VKPQTSLRPRDPNATAAALRSKVPQSGRPAGVSLSSLLQNRAESAIPKAAVPLSPLPDIDSVDKDNPLAAAEYANSIYNYYRRVEPQFSVSCDYMKSQVGDSSADQQDRTGWGPIGQPAADNQCLNSSSLCSRSRSMRRCVAS
jgi:hypothetical protein